jgi:hypothetical protein
MSKAYAPQEVLTIDLPCGCEITVLATDASYRALCWSSQCVKQELDMRARCAAIAAKLVA